MLNLLKYNINTSYKKLQLLLLKEAKHYEIFFIKYSDYLKYFKTIDNRYIKEIFRNSLCVWSK